MVVANSYGAYLFLHAQTLIDPFPGRVLLLSPIVGEFSNSESKTFFVPPRARQLMELLQAGIKLFNSPLSGGQLVGVYSGAALIALTGVVNAFPRDPRFLQSCYQTT